MYVCMYEIFLQLSYVNLFIYLSYVNLSDQLNNLEGWKEFFFLLDTVCVCECKVV